MSFDDRLKWLLVGCAIGFVLGYLTRKFVEKAKGRTKVDKTLTQDSEKTRDESGFFTSQRATQIALVIVVFITAFAAFRSQQASNKVEDSQKELRQAQSQISHITRCNSTVFADALRALNSRTSYTQSQAISNLELQKSQSLLFSILLHKPPYSDERRENATRIYFGALSSFVADATDAKDNAQIVKYPEVKDLEECIRDAKE